MAKFQITGPDGGTYEVEAPDGASESQVLDYVRSQSASLTPSVTASKPQAAPASPAAPAASWGETAADVAKSTGIGLAQGVIGLASLPGNIEMLGRMGIDKGAELLGYQNPNTTASQQLPHYGDYKGAFEQFTGKFYEPKTVPGEYARTAGEFAPAVIGSPGGAVAKAAQIVVPAVVSETAGQMTKGTQYEPWARVGGALAGSALPSVATRAISPNPISPERAQQIANLEKEGVTSLTAGQKTGSRPLKWAESVTQDTPFAGGKAAQMQTDAAEQFTSAILKKAGVNATRATPDVIDNAFVTLGNKFDTLAQHATVKIDQRVTSDLAKAAREYNSLTSPSMRAPIVADFVADVADVAAQHGANAGLSGAAYAAARSELDRQARAVRFTSPQLSEALFNIRNALDEAVERGLPPNMQGQYAQARKEYRNLITIERAAVGAGEDAAMGLISPAMIRNSAKSGDGGRRDYARGRGDFDELARGGTALMTPLPQSGTAPRAYAQGVMQLLSGVAGYGAAGPAGAAGAVAAPAVASRALMSRPVQSYLANQTAVGMNPGRPNMTTLPYGPMLEELMRKKESR